MTTTPTTILHAAAGASGITSTTPEALTHNLASFLAAAAVVSAYPDVIADTQLGYDEDETH